MIESLNILISCFHPAFTTMLCRTGHNFYYDPNTVDFDGDRWQDNIRKRPNNLKPREEFSGNFDLSLCVNASEKSYLRIVNDSSPTIFLHLWDIAYPENITDELLEKLERVVFLSDEVAFSAGMSSHPKTSVILPGVDSKIYSHYAGTQAKVVAIGHYLKDRAEKGYENLKPINDAVDMLVLGYGNEELRGHRFLDDFDAYLQLIRTCRAYLNPSNLIPQSALEMMMLGIPVVQFQPSNYTKYFQDEVNCYIVNTPAEAIARLKELSSPRHREKSISLGRNARQMAIDHFHIDTFTQRWNNLFRSVSS